MPLTLPLKLPYRSSYTSVYEDAFLDFVWSVSKEPKTEVLHKVVAEDSRKDRINLITKRQVALKSLLEYSSSDSVKQRSIHRAMNDYMHILRAFIVATKPYTQPTRSKVLYNFSWYDHHAAKQVVMYDVRYELACVAYNIISMKLLRAKEIMHNMDASMSWQPKTVQILYEEALLAFLTMEEAVQGMAKDHPSSAIPKDVAVSTLYTYRLIVFSCYQLWLSVVAAHNKFNPDGKCANSEDYKMVASLFCVTRRMLENLIVRVTSKTGPSPVVDLNSYTCHLIRYAALWGYASLELYTEAVSGCMISSRLACAKQSVDAGTELLKLVPPAWEPNSTTSAYMRPRAHPEPVIKLIPDFMLSDSTKNLHKSMVTVKDTLELHARVMNMDITETPDQTENRLKVNEVDVSDILTQKVKELYTKDRDSDQWFLWMGCVPQGACSVEQETIYVEWSQVVNKKYREIYESMSRSVVSTMHNIGYPEMCDFIGSKKTIVVADMTTHSMNMVQHALDFVNSDNVNSWIKRNSVVDDSDMDRIVAGHGCSEMVSFMDMVQWLRNNVSVKQKAEFIRQFSELVRSALLEINMLNLPHANSALEVLTMPEEDTALALEYMGHVSELDELWEKVGEVFNSMQMTHTKSPQSMRDMQAMYDTFDKLNIELKSTQLQLDIMRQSDGWSKHTKFAMEVVCAYKKADAIFRYAGYIEILVMSNQ